MFPPNLQDILLILIPALARLHTMSLLHFPSLFLALPLCLLLISPAHSLTCSTQTLPTNKVFANCSDLPTLGASLHYTYNATNSSLSVAFVGAPPKPDGWIGWGINPTSTGMVGGQVLLALKSNGSLLVKPFSLESYRNITEQKLSFDTWDVSAESNKDSFVIFASVKVPEKADSVNQIWQVGGSVTNGKPDKHEMAAANKKATATLALGAANTSPSAGAGNTTGGGKSSGFRSREMSVGVYLGLFAALGFSFW